MTLLDVPSTDTDTPDDHRLIEALLGEYMIVSSSFPTLRQEYGLTTVAVAILGQSETFTYSAFIAELRPPPALTAALQRTASLGLGATIALSLAVALSVITTVSCIVAASRRLDTADVSCCNSATACFGAKGVTVTLQVVTFVLVFVGAALGWASGGNMTSFISSTLDDDTFLTFSTPAGAVSAAGCLILSLIAMVLEASRHCLCCSCSQQHIPPTPTTQTHVIINPAAAGPQQVQQWPSQRSPPKEAWQQQPLSQQQPQQVWPPPQQQAWQPQVQPQQVWPPPQQQAWQPPPPPGWQQPVAYYSTGAEGPHYEEEAQAAPGAAAAPVTGAELLRSSIKVIDIVASLTATEE